MLIRAEQGRQLVETQEREWLNKGPDGQVACLGPDGQMLPHQGDSSVWSMTQNKLKNPGCRSSRGLQRENGTQEQKSAKWRLEFKSKNPSAGRTPKAKPEWQCWTRTCLNRASSMHFSYLRTEAVTQNNLRKLGSCRMKMSRHTFRTNKIQALS